MLLFLLFFFLSAKTSLAGFRGGLWLSADLELQAPVAQLEVPDSIHPRMRDLGVPIKCCRGAVESPEFGCTAGGPSLVGGTSPWDKHVCERNMRCSMMLVLGIDGALGQ